MARFPTGTDKVRIIYFYSVILPSMFVRYWYDKDGILRRRIEQEKP